MIAEIERDVDDNTSDSGDDDELLQLEWNINHIERRLIRMENVLAKANVLDDQPEPSVPEVVAEDEQVVQDDENSMRNKYESVSREIRAAVTRFFARQREKRNYVSNWLTLSASAPTFSLGQLHYMMARDINWLNVCPKLIKRGSTDDPYISSVNESDEELLDLLVSEATGVTKLHLASLNGQLHNKSYLDKPLRHYVINSVTTRNRHTALHYAVHANNFNSVAILLNNGADINITSRRGYTPLALACRLGHARLVKKLVTKYHAATGILTGANNTLLHLAAEVGNLELTKFFITAGCVNTSNLSGMTALHYAVARGHEGIAVTLLEMKADVNARYNSIGSDLFGHPPTCGTTALHQAVSLNLVGIVKTLLQHNAKVNIRDDLGNIALHLAVAFASAEVVQLLLTKPLTKYQIHERCSHGWTALHLAAARGDTDVIGVLLAAGADAQSVSSNHCDPLMIAILVNKWEAAQLLINVTLDLNRYNKIGWNCLHMTALGSPREFRNRLLHAGTVTIHQSVQCSNVTALHIAAASNDIGMVECLLMMLNGSSNWTDDSYWTAVHLACKYGHEEVLKKLLYHRECKIGEPNSEDNTPLHLAIDGKFAGVVKILLTYGANVEKRNKDGNTPLHHACKLGAADIVKLLLDFNADVNARGRGSYTPLLFAAALEDPQIAKMLLQRNAEINRREYEPGGFTPLCQAVSNKRIQLVELLIKHGANLDLVYGGGETVVQVALLVNDPVCFRLLVNAGGCYDSPAEGIIFEDQPCHRKIKCLQTSTGLFWEAILTGDYPQIAHYLRRRSVNWHSREHGLPINYALKEGDHSLLMSLLKYNARLDLPDKDGYYPIHIVAASSRIDILQLMLQKGAVYSVLSPCDQTPLSIAKSCGQSSNLKQLFLIRNVFNGAESGDLKSIELLQRTNGVDRNMFVTIFMAKNERQQTPLTCAFANNKLEYYSALYALLHKAY